MMSINPLIIESFLRDGKKTVDIVSELVKNGNFEDANNLELFRITVHGIKSSLRNIDEADLSDIASLLEDAGRSGDISLINAKAAGFLVDLKAVIEKLQPEQNGSTEGEDPPDLQDKLRELKEMCSDYNRRGALSIIAEITVCTAETRAKLEAIKELVQQSDFEEAEALL